MPDEKNTGEKCRRCDSLCCKYIGVPLEAPQTPGDFDDLVWFLHHEGISIFIDRGEWYMNVATRCTQLDGGKQCKIYGARPRICRGHLFDACEFGGKEYEFEKHFFTAAEMSAYSREFLREKYRKSRKRAPAKNSRRAENEGVRRPPNGGEGSDPRVCAGDCPRRAERRRGGQTPRRPPKGAGGGLTPEPREEDCPRSLKFTTAANRAEAP